MTHPPESSSATRAPSYKGLKPASEHASSAARGSSRKSETRCEIKLRSALWRAGARFRKNVKELPGKPDVVFLGAKVAVFCDGDFWHGRDWETRRKKLAQGNNAEYWTGKIARNRQRDRETKTKLEAEGWTVLRYWESDIHEDPDAIAKKILATLRRLDIHRKKA